MRRFAWLCMGLLAVALLAGCAQVVVPELMGGEARRVACEKEARAAVPSMGEIVNEAAAKTEHPTWTKGGHRAGVGGRILEEARSLRGGV